MKRLTLAVAAVLMAGGAAYAQENVPDAPRYDRDRGDRYDRGYDRYDRDRSRRYEGSDVARVIETRPIAGRDARQECWNPRAGTYEEVREENKTRVGKGAAIGAVAGGVLGHQVDQGGGTAAGAVIGGILGHQIERRRDDGNNTQDDLDYSRCRVAGGADGYEVRYAYDGREYVTRMDRDPGATLRLGRDVREDGRPFNDLAYRDRNRR